MTPSSELFDLIHSLSQAEKRYFKRYAGQHVIGEQNNYVVLFDTLAKMDHYDEEKVKKKLSANREVKDLPSKKNYLKRLIMKSMRGFHRDKSVEVRLMGLLIDLHFLREKNLTYQLRRTLDKTWKLARDHEHYYAMLKVLEYRRFLHKNNIDKHIDQGMEEVLAQMQGVISRLSNEMEYGHLMDRMFIKSRQQFHPQDPTRFQHIEEIMGHPLMKEETLAHSFKSLHYFFNIKAFYHLMKGEKESALTYLGKVVEAWESYPEIKAETASRYHRNLNNYLAGLYESNQYEQMPPIIERIRASNGKSHKVKAEIFDIGHFSELLYFLGTHDFQRAAALIPAIDHGLKKHGKHIPSGRQLSYLYNIVVVYLALEEFSPALRWLNRILNHPSSEHRKDIQAMARVLLQMLHYELGNIDILDNLNRSARRFMSKEETERSFEARVLKFFKKLIDQPSEKEVAKFCGAFLAELDELGKEKTAVPLGFDELRYWLNSKATQRPIREIIAEA